MTEWGLFSEEGCVERGFWSKAEAAARLIECDPGDELYVSALCAEHEEEPADTCEECFDEG